MKDRQQSDDACVAYRETIESAWLESGPLAREETFPPSELDLKLHLDGCPDCTGLARDLARWDRRLNATLHPIGQSIPPPSEERIAATIRGVAEEDPDVRLLRRIRRPLRAIFWGTFYALVLLGGCVLAMAAYRALQRLLMQP
jgi:hypothetical protein